MNYHHWTETVPDITETPSCILTGGARGAMVIVAGCGHGDTSSNPGPD